MHLGTAVNKRVTRARHTRDARAHAGGCWHVPIGAGGCCMWHSRCNVQVSPAEHNRAAALHIALRLLRGQTSMSMLLVAFAQHPV